MNLNLNKNVRFLLAVIASGLILFMNISFIVNPFINTIQVVKQNFETNESKIGDLSKLEKEKEERRKKEEFFKYQLSLITQKLPNNVVPESFITELKNIVLSKGVTAENILFSEPEIVRLKDLFPVEGNQQMLQKANESIYNLFKNDELEDTKSSDEILQYTNIPDDSVVRVNVSFLLSGSYENIKKFINYIELEEKREGDPQNKIIVNSINLSKNKEENKLDGNIKLSFYGIKDKSIPVYGLWKEDIAKGKADFFSSEGAERIDIQGSTVSDFDVKLYPVTSDYPSVIIGKNGNYSTKIYGENAKSEISQIEVQGSAGNYSYRYNTQSTRYPVDGGWEVFDPQTKNDIIIKIYSTPRLVSDNPNTPKDESGIDLRVINRTDKEVKIIKYNDDSEYPRVKYTVSK